jgi:hypothetical protein
VTSFSVIVRKEPSVRNGFTKGNVYTAEVDTGKRIQKFKLTSDALR